jgi:uncharacterized membrane protein YccC
LMHRQEEWCQTVDQPSESTVWGRYKELSDAIARDLDDLAELRSGSHVTVHHARTIQELRAALARVAELEAENAHLTSEQKEYEEELASLRVQLSSEQNGTQYWCQKSRRQEEAHARLLADAVAVTAYAKSGTYVPGTESAIARILAEEGA